MAAEDPTVVRAPRDVAEARDVLARAVGIRVDRLLAALFGVEQHSLESILQDCIDRSSSRQDFISNATSAIAKQSRRPGLDILANIRGLTEDIRAKEASEDTPVANQTDHLVALGREVSGLNSKVNILLWAGGIAGTTFLLAIVGGAIALWQEIGGVETRLTRELGQVETRITQQIADVRSEVGEIRGRLSALGQAPSTPR